MKGATRRTMRVLLPALFVAAAHGACPFFTTPNDDASQAECTEYAGFSANNERFIAAYSKTEDSSWFMGHINRQENTCDNGFAVGRICQGAADGAADRETCVGREVYEFTVEAAGAFEANCVVASEEGNTCSFNAPAEGWAVECANGADACCASCYTGFTLTDGQCIANVCTCENGTEATGADCTTDGAAMCAPGSGEDGSGPCDAGFTHEGAGTESQSCRENSCTCENGQGATGAACAEDGTVFCLATGCNDGYTYSMTDESTAAPTDAATDAATDETTAAPTDAATDAATDETTAAPTDAATDAATDETTAAPTDAATDAPTDVETAAPTTAAPRRRLQQGGGQCTPNTCGGCVNGTGLVGAQTVTVNGVEREENCETNGAAGTQCASCNAGYKLASNLTCQQAINYIFLEGDGGMEYVPGSSPQGALVGDTIDRQTINGIPGYGCADGYVARDFTYVVTEDDVARTVDLDNHVTGELNPICGVATCPQFNLHEQDVGNAQTNAQSETTTREEASATLTCPAGHQAAILSEGVRTPSSTITYNCVLNKPADAAPEPQWENNLAGDADADAPCQPMTTSYTYHNGLELVEASGLYLADAEIECAAGFITRETTVSLELNNGVDAAGQPNPVDFTETKFCDVKYGDIEFKLEGAEGEEATVYNPPGRTGARSGDYFELVCPSGYVLKEAWRDLGEQVIVFNAAQEGCVPGKWPLQQVEGSETYETPVVCEPGEEPEQPQGGAGEPDSPGVAQSGSGTLQGLPQAGQQGGGGLQGGGGAGVNGFGEAWHGSGAGLNSSSRGYSGSEAGEVVGGALGLEAQEYGVTEEFVNNARLGDIDMAEQQKVAGLSPLYIVLIVGGALLLFGICIWVFIVKTENPQNFQQIGDLGKVRGKVVDRQDDEDQYGHADEVGIYGGAPRRKTSQKSVGSYQVGDKIFYDQEQEPRKVLSVNAHSGKITMTTPQPLNSV